MKLITLCSYLKTKESYNSWITRRVWGFRYQISKAKKSKNVGRKYREASGEFRSRARGLRNFAAVQEGCEISQHEGHHFAAKG